MISILISSLIGISGDYIVRKADEVRGPQKPFSIKFRMVYYKVKKKDSLTAEIFVRDKRTSLVRFFKPSSMKGRIILMKGDDVWIYIPRTRNPIRLTPQQRLLGQASTGDVARLNYSGDYTAKLLGVEKVLGKTCYHLKLSAKRKGVTYHSIDYWVEKETFRPVKAIFYTKTGKPMKEVEFRDYGEILGGIRPKRLVIKDMVKKNEYTEIIYLKGTYRTLPKHYFNKNFLPRIR